MKSKPVIAILLGCLMMVITGHSIVPHPHHSDDAYSHAGCEQFDACDPSGAHAGTKQPADSKQHAGTNDPAGHCHAFNGLEYVLRFEKKIPAQPIAESLSIGLSSVIFRDESLSRKVFADGTEGPPPEFNGFLGESASLRAPPFIS